MDDARGELIVLGIETSCDETAAAVVLRDALGGRRVLAERVLSQLSEHRPYGGVVPEIAARAHLAHLDGLIEETMTAARLRFDELSAIAATSGPGLIGGVIVGCLMGKAIASVHRKPFVAVNHLEGHALSVRLVEDVEFPYLLLLVSGGHCQLLLVEGVGAYRRLGTTADDAAGEAFDKVAKLLGLPYPGGPAIERAAKAGNAARFALPKPLFGKPGCDFSFSGLKTAARQTVEKLPPGPLAEQDVADVAAGLQRAIADVLADRAGNAMRAFRKQYPGAATPAFVVAGGVAANGEVRTKLASMAAQNGFRCVAPPLELCTDNAAMIAWAGIERLSCGLVDGLDFAPRPRWPLEELRRPARPARPALPARPA